MEHAGGVRRGVASIWDRSFDLISILGQIDFGSNSYIGIEMIFFWNRSFKIDLGQTAPSKMTAMTIGWYQVFCEKLDLIAYLPLKSRFSGQTLISIFPYNWIISWGINIVRVLMFSEESWGNPPGGYTCLLVPSLRENKPSKTLLKATGEKNKPAASTSTLKLG